MPDYKRLVSYMYNYEDGSKRNNVGYARVEARNGQCKYTIHITAPSLNEKQLKVYLFRRDAEDMEGILLGAFQIRNGIGDFKTITEASHIKGTSYGLDDMGGIVLYYNERKFFATEWDSRPVLMSKVYAMDKRELKKAEQINTKTSPNTENKENINTDIKAATVAEAVAKVEKEKVQEKADNIIFFKKEEKNNKVHIPAEEEPLNDLLTPNLKSVIDSANASLDEELLSKELIKNNKDIFEKENKTDGKSPAGSPVKESKSPENPIKEDKADISFPTFLEEPALELPAEENAGKDAEGSIEEESGEKAEEITNGTAKVITPEAAEKSVKESEKEKAAKTIDEHVENVKEALEDANAENIKEKAGKETAEQENETSSLIFEDHPLAKQIYKGFPRMYPFEDNEIAWCARIEPKDIGMLPTDYWGLGNNSFLLHGYYSYRHLIFARSNDKNGYNYILGVPGIYHNREKFMAKMFGFENFKCTKRKPQRTGEFGYWYIPIVLN